MASTSWCVMSPWTSWIRAGPKWTCICVRPWSAREIECDRRLRRRLLDAIGRPAQHLAYAARVLPAIGVGRVVPQLAALGDHRHHLRDIKKASDIQKIGTGPKGAAEVPQSA